LYAPRTSFSGRHWSRVHPWSENCSSVQARGRCIKAGLHKPWSYFTILWVVTHERCFKKRHTDREGVYTLTQLSFCKMESLVAEAFYCKPRLSFHGLKYPIWFDIVRTSCDRFANDYTTIVKYELIVYTNRKPYLV
jgi:hypothetical protein